LAPAEDISIDTIDKVESAADLQPLWGNWIFRDSVILQAGEPGISKTTFNYSLCKAIVDNQHFLEVKPTEPHLRVLMLDWESSPSLIKSRMRAMGYPKNFENFFVYCDPHFTMYELEPYIESLGIRPDIIIVDPLRYAFGMRDENDNAEASRQAKFLRQVSMKYSCAVIVVHHSSKGELSGWKKASGASARTSLADIAMNFDTLDEEVMTNQTTKDSKDIFILSIPKNRLIDDKFTAFIKKNDKKFEIVSPPAGYNPNGDYNPSLREYSSQQKVAKALNFYLPQSPNQIHQSLGGDKSMSIRTVYNTLSHLMALGQAERIEYGKYRLALGRKK